LTEVEVEDPAWTEALPNAEALVLTAADATLASEGAVGQGVTLLLTDDVTIGDLNRRFRQQDKPTNVLSFPSPQNPERFLGDVALAYGVCAHEAFEQGKPLAHHLQHLVAHGVLHLLGYDHISDAQADEMEGLERAVLAGLGIPDPYLAGEGDHDRHRPIG
jgi:probable rRNA maturation factor